MLPRSSWKGSLRLSLVAVPVQAINIEGGTSPDVKLHQLHDKCHSRIQYRKVCPIHGEVDPDEIVYGYEAAKDEYVVVDDEASNRKKDSGARGVDLDAFVPLASIDPLYFSGSTYYLVPDGAAGEKPYAVLHKAMSNSKRGGIGLGQFWGKERLVLIRPVGELLSMHMLNFASQIRQPEAIARELTLPAVKSEELRLAVKLIEASTSNRLNLSKYQDEANEKLREQIEAKLEDQDVVTAPGAKSSGKAPPVINLMDALRKSVTQAKKPAARAAAPKAKAKARAKPRTAARKRSAG